MAEHRGLTTEAAHLLRKSIDSAQSYLHDIHGGLEPLPDETPAHFIFRMGRLGKLAEQALTDLHRAQNMINEYVRKNPSPASGPSGAQKA